MLKKIEERTIQLNNRERPRLIDDGPLAVRGGYEHVCIGGAPPWNNLYLGGIYAKVMEPLHAKQAFLVITQAPDVGHVAAKPRRTAGGSSALATAFNKSYAHGHLGIFFRIVLHHTQVINACPANDHDLKSLFHADCSPSDTASNYHITFHPFISRGAIIPDFELNVPINTLCT
jgi:hypothetical protein